MRENKPDSSLTAKNAATSGALAASELVAVVLPESKHLVGLRDDHGVGTAAADVLQAQPGQDGKVGWGVGPGLTRSRGLVGPLPTHHSAEQREICCGTERKI